MSMTRSEEELLEIKSIAYDAKSEALLNKCPLLPITFEVNQKVEQQNRSPFAIASLYGYNEVLKKIIARGDDISAEFYADVFYKDIKYLITEYRSHYKPRFHLPSAALSMAVSTLQTDSVNLLSEQKGMDPTAALFALANSYKLDMVKQFNPSLPEEKYSQTRVEIAQRLLKMGANADAVLPFSGSKLKADPEEETICGFDHLLLYAMGSADVAMVELLLPLIKDPRIIKRGLELGAYFDDNTGIIEELVQTKKSAEVAKIIKLIVDKAAMPDLVSNKTDQPVSLNKICYSIYQDGTFRDVDNVPYLQYKKPDLATKKLNDWVSTLNGNLFVLVQYIEKFDQYNISTLRYLVEKGADINSALHSAIDVRNLEMFKFCIENGASLGEASFWRLESDIGIFVDAIKEENDVKKLSRYKDLLAECYSILVYYEKYYLESVNEFLKHLESYSIDDVSSKKLHEILSEFKSELTKEKSIENYDPKKSLGHYISEIHSATENLRKSLRDSKLQDMLDKLDQFLGLPPESSELTYELFKSFINKRNPLPTKTLNSSVNKTLTDEIKESKTTLSTAVEFKSSIPVSEYGKKLEALPNNKLLIAGEYGHPILLWNGNTSTIDKEIKPHTPIFPLWQVFALSKERFLITGCTDDKSALIIDSENNEKVTPFPLRYHDAAMLDPSGIFIRKSFRVNEFDIYDLDGKQHGSFSLPEHIRGAGIFTCVALDQGRFITSTDTGISLFQWKDENVTFLQTNKLDSKDSGCIARIMPYQDNQFLVKTNTLSLWEVTDKNELKFIKRAPEYPLEIGCPYGFEGTKLSHDRIATFQSLMSGEWEHDHLSFDEQSKFGTLSRKLLCIWDVKELKPTAIIKFDKELEKICALSNDQLAVSFRKDPNVLIITVPYKPELKLKRHQQVSTLFQHKEELKKTGQLPKSEARGPIFSQ